MVISEWLVPIITVYYICVDASVILVHTCSLNIQDSVKALANVMQNIKEVQNDVSKGFFSENKVKK